MPGVCFCLVNAAREKNVTGMALGPQPGDETHEFALRHRGAPRGRTRDSATDVKKDCAAFARHGRIGVVPNLDQPAVGKIVMSHFLLCEPRGRICRVIDRDKTIVVRAVHVIDPGVGCRHLMKRIIRAGGKEPIVGVDLSNPKNSSRRAPIALGFPQAAFILSQDRCPRPLRFCQRGPERPGPQTTNSLPACAQIVANGRASNSNPARYRRSIECNHPGAPAAYPVAASVIKTPNLK